MNPDWEVRFYTPLSHNHDDAKWVSHSHKEKYTGPCYLHRLHTLGVKTQVFDFAAAGFPHDIHEAYKSDFLRWFLLYNVGGFWSDTDVIFFRPLTTKVFEEHDFCITADMNPTIYYIAYIYAKHKCPAAGTIMRAALQKGNFDPMNYQCLGNVLVQKCFPYERSYNEVHPNLKFKLMNPAVNLPIKRVRNIEKIFEKSRAVDCSDSVGLHWFGGHPMAYKWENIITPGVSQHVNTTLCETIRSLDLCSL